MHPAAQQTRRGQAGLPLIASAGMLVLVSAAAWWYFASKPTLPTDQGQAIIDEFFQQLRAGKTDQAWSATAADFKSYLGREAFRAYVAQHPELKQPLEYQSHSAAANAVISEYIYQSASAAAKNKAPRTIKVRLVQEAKQWKVESLGIQ